MSFLILVPPAPPGSMLKWWAGDAHERTKKMDALLGFMASSNIELGGGEGGK